MLKSSNNLIRFLIIPLALCAMMFNAQCQRDNSNEEFYQQLLLNLASCKEGGSMRFNVDSVNERVWTCCVARYNGTYWEVIGSGDGEVMRLFIGDGLPTSSPFTASTKASHEYIQFNSFYGVTDGTYGGDSSIAVTTNDADRIIGSFSGKVCLSTGLTCRDVASTVSFTAVK